MAQIDTRGEPNGLGGNAERQREGCKRAFVLEWKVSASVVCGVYKLGVPVSCPVSLSLLCWAFYLELISLFAKLFSFYLFENVW